jgi:hypothetical protein
MFTWNGSMLVDLSSNNKQDPLLKRRGFFHLQSIYNKIKNMKHILNNLTEQEKNAIREQHSGGMKVMTEKFSKLINSKLGDSKPLVAEQIQSRIPSGPSPVAKPTSPSQITSPKPNNSIVPCSQLGIKSLGSCDSKTKRPIDYCSALGVKTPGYCYIDTKQPMTSTRGGTMQNEQVMQALKNVAMKGMDYAKKGLNIIQGKTGNKFFDAAIGAKLGKMQDGKSSNEKVFCMDDSCEDSVRVFSDGRIVFERAEFGTKDKGKMVLNSDNSFVIKFDDGTSSNKFKPQ